MADKPTTGHLEWITDDDPDKFIEPSGAKKLAGWLKLEKPPFQYFNWAFRVMDRWLQYFEAASDEETAARIAGDAAEAAARIAGDIEAGTCIAAFGQNTAPTGWTRKDDWQDNAMLCYAATGDIGSGGDINPQAGHSHDLNDHRHTMFIYDYHATDPETLKAIRADTENYEAFVEEVTVASGSGATAWKKPSDLTTLDRTYISSGAQGSNPFSTSSVSPPYYQEVIAATKD
ncbi:hypothetical protein DSCW_18020 [Desulfosarcina widdelii]|uniref:Uncharacterized protein n=1 Tax=Desulfosarcina widdelii TaxID=947919 RepID=A0A5K7Z111_9BACT|nr:hypothetical protein [Desulfosarcina widdelii]BBO74385.1 hypothetical protein DSCW_18020 [Desulfosarcina widdelii]